MEGVFNNTSRRLITESLVKHNTSPILDWIDDMLANRILMAKRGGCLIQE